MTAPNDEGLPEIGGRSLRPDLFGGPVTDDSPQALMLRLGSGHLAAQAVHVFARLGIADLLRDGSRSADEIATLTSTHGDALARVLRFLATIGVVAADDREHYALTRLGSTLCTQPSSAIRDNVLLMSSPGYWGAIGRLTDAVASGQVAFEVAHGAGFFDHLERTPHEAATFNAAMNSSSRLGHAAIMTAYDFGDADLIVDVAGGQGGFLERVLTRCARPRGLLFDAPRVIESVTIPPSLADRMSKVSGSFFDAIPAGGDLYVLRRILHDWNDDEALAILRRCREACHPAARLLVIEAAPPADGESANNWAAMDLLMMILMNGRERTEAQFRSLFADAGFRLTRTARTHSPLWLLEAVPE